MAQYGSPRSVSVGGKSIRHNTTDIGHSSNVPSDTPPTTLTTTNSIKNSVCFSQNS